MAPEMLDGWWTHMAWSVRLSVGAVPVTLALADMAVATLAA